MDYKDIDYRSYLSVDNGKGILVSKEDVMVLERYGFDYFQYQSLGSLIFDIESYCNDYGDSDELEEVLQRLSEMYYYHYVNK